MKNKNFSNGHRFQWTAWGRVHSVIVLLGIVFLLLMAFLAG